MNRASATFGALTAGLAAASLTACPAPGPATAPVAPTGAPGSAATPRPMAPPTTSPEDRARAEAIAKEAADLLSAGDAAGAAEKLRAAIEVDPVSADLRVTLAKAMRRAEAPDADVHAVLARAIAIAPRHAEANLLLGRMARDAGRPKEAANHFRVAREGLPGDHRIRLELALALDDSGDREAASAEYRGVIAERPSDVTAYLRLAELLERAAKDYEAEEILEALTVAAPSSPLGWIRLAQLYARRGETAKADRAAAEARKLGAEVEPDKAFDKKERPLPKSPK